MSLTRSLLFGSSSLRVSSSLISHNLFGENILRRRSFSDGQKNRHPPNVVKIASKPISFSNENQRVSITRSAIQRLREKYQVSGGPLQVTAAAEFVTRSFVELSYVIVCCDDKGIPKLIQADSNNPARSIMCFTTDEIYERWSKCGEVNTEKALANTIRMSGYDIITYAAAILPIPPFGVVIDMEHGIELKSDYIKFTLQYYKEAKQLDSIMKYKKTLEGIELDQLPKQESNKIINNCFDDFLNNGIGQNNWSSKEYHLQSPYTEENSNDIYLPLYSTPLTFLNSMMDKPGWGQTLPSEDSFLPFTEQIKLMKTYNESNENNKIHGFLFNPPHNSKENLPGDFQYGYKLDDVWF